jgi:hypothetical protein
MARAELTLQATVRTGLNPSYTAAAADGHSFDNESQRVALHVKNAGGGPVVVTINTVPPTLDGLAIPDLQVTVPAGEERFIGPFPKDLYTQDDSGGDTGVEKAVFVDTDTQTGITYAAFRLGSLAY